MQLDILEGTFAIAKLPPHSEIPAWARGGEFLSITSTADELSIVSAAIPASVECRRGWKCLKVRGPLDFSWTGILASIAAPLAQASIPIFAISTFDTDYILIFESDLARAVAALGAAGHSI